MSEKSFYEDGELKLSKEEQLEYLKEQEIDRISNGECPKISYDLWLSRLTISLSPSPIFVGFLFDFFFDFLFVFFFVFFFRSLYPTNKVWDY